LIAFLAALERYGTPGRNQRSGGFGGGARQLVGRILDAPDGVVQKAVVLLALRL
jgi:hypothetical protein